MFKWLLMCGLTLVLAACAVGPDYVRPGIEPPSAWTVDPDAAAELADQRWWQQFNDTALDGLIDTALKENLDLRIATARIDQYLGQLQTTRADFFPQLGAGATVSRRQDSAAGLVPSDQRPYNTYQGTLNATWELDLWGRIRRSSEAARADLLASEAGRRAVLLSLTANVANAYLGLRGLDRQLEIARETERVYTETLRIFRLRQQYGAVSALEISQVESQYQVARQAIPQLEGQIARQEHLLSLLLGRNPGAIARGKAIDTLDVPGIPAGLPSTLLTRRPDIVQAEQALIAANARIGAARARYFPTVSLTGVLGTASIHTASLFNAPAEFWQVGGEVLAPIFTFGAIEGQVKVAESQQQQALLHYRQTILSAFREVEDALIATAKGREQLSAQEQQVTALENYARLARLQYEAGTTSYLQVLDADRALFSGQLGSVQTRAGTLTSLVDIYRAMGGGWVDEADRLAAVPGNTPNDLK
jgi:multidrug efflux system outer membrane protein